MPNTGFDARRRLLSDALGLTGNDSPFAWQEELLGCFVRGEIPEALDLPTGLGKTAVIAIWLVARTCGASLPRRLVYVVDRRAVVDQATEEAVRLREFIDRNADIRHRLDLKEARSLPISTLRGQHVDNGEWLEDPSAPAIIVGTVDMIGSRLLFEGYRVSRKMRPYHAGLLGADTLVVLDEAHLVPPFERLLRTVANDVALAPRTQQLRAIIPAFKLLPLSATRHNVGNEVFGLTAKDFEHPIVNRRLNAKKHLGVQPLKEDAKLEEEIAQRAWDLSDKGKSAMRYILFCDERRVAERAKDAVEKLAKGDRKPGSPPPRSTRSYLSGAAGCSSASKLKSG